MAGRLLIDSEIPTSIGISPKKVLEDYGKQVPCLINKEAGAHRTLVQVHTQMTKVRKNADLYVVNPELCISFLGTWLLSYEGYSLGFIRVSALSKTPVITIAQLHGRQSHALGEVIP